MTGLEVIKCSPLTTIQDNGRFAYSHLGITQSGAADKYSFNLLNQLLENPFNTNCLEIYFGNIKLRSHTTNYIAITGATTTLKINSQIVSAYKVHKICPNDIIEIGSITNGKIVYFGIKGGFQTQKELGSYSVTPKDTILSKLTKNDFLQTINCQRFKLKSLKKEFIPKFEKELILRVTLGYQVKEFDSKEIENFFNTTFTITNQSNKMGVKFLADKKINTSKEIISEPISFGAIQIPKDGNPVVLLNERQTIGGYPKIGSVLPIDCYKLSQAIPNTTVNFQVISIEDAISKMKRFHETFSNN